MFDSGYTLPQGREVLNFYYPLQYGIEGIIKICTDEIKNTAGYPEMDRLYYYQATIIMLEGIKKWMLNYADEAMTLASLEENEIQKDEYLQLLKG